jgi:hypothetical protein
MILDDPIFVLSAITLICGSVGLMVKFCYKSRCKKCEVCCIKIERDNALENEEDLNNMKYVNTTESTKQKNDDIV